jgi:hypothetical protein
VSIVLATEDLLSEAVGERLLAESPKRLEASQKIRQGGWGYLRSRADQWREIARHRPVVLITDLDRHRCPKQLLEDWFGDRPLSRNLVVRIAVREVESWLLADHEGLAKLFGRDARMHPRPDELTDPKQHLLTLAAKARRDVRADLVAERGAIARQGIGYNSRLATFVGTIWSPLRAGSRSASLRRAQIRINELAARLA